MSLSVCVCRSGVQRLRSAVGIHGEHLVIVVVISLLLLIKYVVSIYCLPLIITYLVLTQ